MLKNITPVNAPLCNLTRGDVYETKAYHHWCLVTVIVEEDQINTPVSSPQAFIRQFN